MDGNRHYIKLDGNLIVKAFSDAFEQPEEGDVCVNESGGRHFTLDLYREDGLPRYKYEGGAVVEATEADLADQLAELALNDELARLEKQLDDGDWMVARQASSDTHKMPDAEYAAFIAGRDVMRDRIDTIRAQIG